MFYLCQTFIPMIQEPCKAINLAVLIQVSVFRLKLSRMFWLQKWRWVDIAFTWGKCWPWELFIWFCVPNSILVANPNACSGSTISLRCSFLFSVSSILTISISHINVFHCLPTTQFSENISNFPNENSANSHLDCFILSKTQRPEVIFLVPMKASSLRRQWSAAFKIILHLEVRIAATFNSPDKPLWEFFDQLDSSVCQHKWWQSQFFFGVDSLHSISVGFFWHVTRFQIEQRFLRKCIDAVMR